MKWWAVPAGIAGAVALGFAAFGAVTIAKGDLKQSMPWRLLYAASESMAPTVRKGVRLTARRVSANDLKRGDVVAFFVGESIWIQRVVGLPGDKVAMRGGLIILNNKPVPQSDAGSLEIDGVAATVRSERLPGAVAHRILDQGQTVGDDMPAVQVPPGKLFLLGDNRDNAMDSRFSDFVGNLAGGMVSFDAVYGIVRPEDIGE